MCRTTISIWWALTRGRSWFDVPIHDWEIAGSKSEQDEYWVEVLSNQYVEAQLKQGTPAFNNKSSASTSRYTSATAAIKVTPSTDKHYDISQIKTDTEWLSKELELNEVQALRVVLLEWQNRPKLHLLAGYSEAEVASLRDVYGSRLAFDADFEASTLRVRNEDDFQTDTARRRRQVFIHFQECIGLTRTWLALQDQELAKHSRLLVRSTPISALSKEDVLENCMDLLVKQIIEYQEGPIWSVIDDDTNYMWQIGHIFCLQNLMQAVIVLIRSVQRLPASPVMKWMRIMADVQFLQSLEPSPLLPPKEVEQFQTLVAITTLALIDPANTIAELDKDPEHHWIHDFDATSEVHQIFLNAVDSSCLQAVPAAFAWTLVLSRVAALAAEAQSSRDSPVATRSHDIGTYDSATGRKTSILGSTDESPYEHIMSAVSAVAPNPHSIELLLDHTLNTFAVADRLAAAVAFDTDSLLPVTRRARLKFVQEVVAAAISELPPQDKYSSHTLTPQLATLSGQDPADTCEEFLDIDHLRNSIFEVAATRFPFEALPFLKLCRYLARAEVFDSRGNQYITTRLASLTSFTHMADDSLQTYHTTREDENLNLVALDQHAYAFPQNSLPLLTQRSDKNRSLILEAGTEGEVVSDTDPPVIRWHIPSSYSGLAIIGEWLELRYNGLLQGVLSDRESSTDVASEMILLLANLLTTTYGQQAKDKRDEAIQTILDQSNENLSLSTTIVSLGFDIIEQELQGYRRRPTNVYDTSVLNAAIQFVHSILKVRPSDFWQHISRTSLTSAHGGSSLLYLVISGIESLSGDASLTLSTSRLYRDLITAALRRPADPLVRQWRSKPGLKSMRDTGKTFETVLSSMTENLLEIFESMSEWKSVSFTQEPEIISTLCECFGQILKYGYGVGGPSSELTSCFNSAASSILSRLLPETTEDAKNGPILSHLVDAMELTETFTPGSAIFSCHQALLNLSRVLVTVAESEKASSSGLEACLLDLAPVLIRKLARANVTDRSESSRLLAVLMSSGHKEKPASLLGRLGSSSCIDVVNILAAAQALPIRLASSQAWRLLNCLISGDQQWLSLVILTGAIPNKEGKTTSGEQNVYRGKQILDTALDCLADTRTRAATDTEVVTSVVKFMITAQQNWSWTLASLRARQDVFANLVQYVCQTPDIGHSSMDAHRRLLVALITDLSSVHLQYAKSVRDLGLMKIFMPLLNWLTTNAIEVGSFNSSLHINLAKNFKSKFGLDLNDFRNHNYTSQADIEYYDMQTATLVLNDRTGWRTQENRSSSTDQSYFAEVGRANDNLRLVEAELTLLHSFQKLCIEHASFFVQDATIQKTMAHIAQRCLMANAKKYPAERLFDSLLQTRGDMALSLVQRLVEKRVHGTDYRELLKPAWDCTVFVNPSYEQAIENDDLHYLRTCLMIVVLTMQFHLGAGWKPLAGSNASAADLLKHTSGVMPQMLEIATVIIGQGLATIVSTLQEQKQAEMQQEAQDDQLDIGLKDLGIILNLLETILRMPRLPDFAAQLSERLIGTGTVQSASKLYMWAHLLAGADTDNEPIHADIAIRLLVSLSSLSAVAEEMAIDGLLSSILTARVTQVLQKMPDGTSNLDQRPHCRMLYTIWAEGILPLTLNLLHAVGAPMAAEISSFLNAFPEQLVRAGSAFRPREGDFITLSSAKESATLSLLSFMLDDYRNAGASAAVDPASIVPLTGFDEHKKALSADLQQHVDLDRGPLRSKIVPTSEKELAWHAGGKLVLTEKVLAEMKMALACLGSADNGEMENKPLEKDAGYRVFGD